MKYWAHSDPAGLLETDPAARWQPLNEHLRQVGTIAEALARQAKPGDTDFHDIARAAGLLHDLGKYTPEFQRKIRGESHLKAPHSAYGAAIARKAKALEAAYAIAGHHGGLPNPRGGSAGLWERTNEVRGRLDSVWRSATDDCPELSACINRLPVSSETLRHFDVRTRMLFSCSVDADRIDSSGDRQTGAPLSPGPRLEMLRAFIQNRAARVPDGSVKQARMAVLDACQRAAGNSGNIFSLTAPTGGGKTLASMAFALERALVLSEIRRVIVVIPFLSIIEQNAQVFREALGSEAILEHHSGDLETTDDEDWYKNPARRHAIENWDAPIIITTSVRFFESLFSHRPADLRRVHNIARSVVILDEVQTLPRNLLRPILGIIEDLAANWQTTFLFCTATQPAFEKSKPEDPRWPAGTVQEVMPRPRDLFSKLKRVEVEWPRQQSTWQEIATGLAKARRALCIVNTRKHAMTLYREVSGDPAIDGTSVFCLSTRMCPAHRLKAIREIKTRLEHPDTLPCVVVSTQLVEAGVDFDFPVVYRAVGPLDSIAQAAGRCDREGRLSAKLGRPAGKVIVFEPPEPNLPTGVYREATERTQALIREGGVSIDSPESLRRYFDRLYAEADLGEEIEQLRTAMRFRDLGESFEMISDKTQSIFVPYDEESRKLLAELNSTGVLHLRLRRSLERYTVGLYPHELMEAAAKGALYEVRPGSRLWICPAGLYSEKLGFVTEPTAKEMLI